MQEDGDGGSVEQAPIIIKKVSGHGGHHGGAWKVAYADFVTAMMALFMVLWLMNANEKEKEAISSYFKDPTGSGDKAGAGQAGAGTGMAVGKNDMEGLADSIQEAMKAMPQFEKLKEQVQMSVTGDGLRIELLETEGGMFFQSGSPAPSEPGREILRLITGELAKLPNKIVIEGHTDSKPFRAKADYSNWELSVDRATSARRILLASGMGEDRIVQVRGFADVNLRRPDDPENASNRRISLIVMYDEQPPTEPAPEQAAPSEGSTDHGETPPTAQPAH